MSNKLHKANPELWTAAEKFANNTMDMANCLLELRARVKVLESTQHAHIEGTLKESRGTSEVPLHSYKIGPAEPIGNWGKGQFTPVTLTPSTQEAMARIATAPQTSEQGVQFELQANGSTKSLDIDWKNSSEPQYNKYGTEGLVEGVDDIMTLVERMAVTVATAPNRWEDKARAAILATADWLDGIELHVAAARLRQEVEQ